MAKPIYCYETKQRFRSLKSAAKWCSLKCPAGIYRALDNPQLTAGGYHWCTSLSVFDEIELTNNFPKPIYCYETEERFKSLTEAASSVGRTKQSIHYALNNPNRTSGGYHWCTDLDNFKKLMKGKTNG